MAAAWMAHCGIKTRIVDKRNAKIFSGQADGLQCRSLEIFDSLGFGDRAWKEANHMIEVSRQKSPVCGVCSLVLISEQICMWVSAARRAGILLPR